MKPGRPPKLRVCTYCRTTKKSADFRRSDVDVCRVCSKREYELMRAEQRARRPGKPGSTVKQRLALVYSAKHHNALQIAQEIQRSNAQLERVRAMLPMQCIRCGVLQTQTEVGQDEHGVAWCGPCYTVRDQPAPAMPLDLPPLPEYKPPTLPEGWIEPDDDP